MSQATITLIILAVAITLFIVDKFPMGLVAFCVPLALYFTGIIEAKIYLNLSLTVTFCSFWECALSELPSSKQGLLTLQAACYLSIPKVRKV